MFSLSASLIGLSVVAKDLQGVVSFTPLAQRACRNSVALGMVRNIDLPECLVFYGLPDSLFSEEEVDSGLASLLQECSDTDTAVVVIPEDSSPSSRVVPSYCSHLPTKIDHHLPKSSAPNPLDLYEALNSITVQPRPFGGSSGFGAKQYADPERVPLAARTVVVCQTLDQTRAARYCGMRVLCLEDNDLADAVVDAVDFWLDDIATPGSFWLNPPVPRDDEGNKVDIHELIDFYSQQQQQPADSGTQTEDDSQNGIADDDMSDEELQQILSDLSPL